MKKRRCPRCRKALVRRQKESNLRWANRQTCGRDCGRALSADKNRAFDRTYDGNTHDGRRSR